MTPFLKFTSLSLSIFIVLVEWHLAVFFVVVYVMTLELLPLAFKDTK